jgi:hypothetical protein
MPKVLRNLAQSVVEALMPCLIAFLPTSRLLWAAPCSLLGLLLCAVALLAGGQIRWADGALECCLGEGALVRWLQHHQPFAAITLGHVILALRAEDLRRWYVHERVHVKQFERWGALLLLAYPAASLWAWLCGRDPYFANCFEREAYREEEKI